MLSNATRQQERARLSGDLLTVKQLADRYRVSSFTIRRWIKSGRLTARKVGKNLLVSEVDMGGFPQEEITNASLAKAKVDFSIRLNSRQEKIYKHLCSLSGEGVAEIYLSALFNLKNKPPDWKAHFSHAIRELVQVVPAVILGYSQPSRGIDQRLIQRLKDSWEEITPIMSVQSTSLDDPYVSHAIEKLNEIDPLIKEHNEAEHWPDFLEEGFGKVLEENTSLPAPTIRNFTRQLGDIVNKYGHKIAHHSWLRPSEKAKEVIEPKESELNQVMDEIDDILFRWSESATYLDDVPHLRKLSQIATPSRKNQEDLVRLFTGKNEAGHLAKLRYFLDKISSFAWIEALNRKGFFSEPPKVKRTEKYLEIPPWSQSQALRRLAEQNPTVTVSIIEKNKSTENSRVIHDFLGAAIKLPDNHAEKIGRFAVQSKWLDRISAYGASLLMTDLAIKLGANHHTSKTGLSMVDYLLILDREDEAKPSYKKIKAKLDDWEYGEVVKKVSAPTSPFDLMKVGVLLSSRLDEALEEKDYGRQPDYDDASYIWRRDLEKPSSHVHDIDEMLVSGVINCILALGEKTDISNLVAFVDELGKFKYQIFRRFELFAVTRFPEHFSAKIFPFLNDNGLLFIRNIQTEYLALLSSQFANFSQEQKDQLTTKIVSGPAFSDFPPKDDSEAKKIQEIREQYVVEYLHPIHEQLTGKALARYSTLVTKLGVPKYTEGLIQTWTGPTSPLRKEKLIKLSSDKLGSYLVLWQPEKGWAKPSPDGLGRMLSESVSEDPLKYKNLASSLFDQKARPVYLYDVFWGLEIGLKAKGNIDWATTLATAKKIVLTEKYEGFPEPFDDHESSWRSVHQAIVSLIGQGLLREQYRIPFEYRETVWAVIEKLCSHEEPTPEFEQKFGGKNMDPLTMAINTVRGEAFHALIRYALWCNDNLRGIDDLEKRNDRMVPEVERVLNEHLDFSIDPSVTVRSVYGQYLPQISYLNSKWLASKIDKIFPSEPNLDSLWKAAIGSYFYNRVYRDLFALLVPVLKVGINKLLPHESDEEYEKWEEGLADQIMLGFAHGFDSGKELAGLFFQKASASVSRKAIWFVGANILNKFIKESADGLGVQIQKLKTLWSEFTANENLNPEVLEGFGWWFVNSPFEKLFTIQQLLKTLEKTKGRVEWSNKVVEELPQYATDFPELVIQSAKLLIEGEDSYGSLQYKAPNYIQIIKLVQATKSVRAKKLAVDLLNKLAEKGLEKEVEIASS